MGSVVQIAIRQRFTSVIYENEQQTKSGKTATDWWHLTDLSHLCRKSYSSSDSSQNHRSIAAHLYWHNRQSTIFKYPGENG